MWPGSRPSSAAPFNPYDAAAQAEDLVFTDENSAAERNQMRKAPAQIVTGRRGRNTQSPLQELVPSRPCDVREGMQGSLRNTCRLCHTGVRASPSRSCIFLRPLLRRSLISLSFVNN